ncbi:MAG: hypothetical protein KC910_33380 [Candidatus Eremiobacteraeota bacterium]|nr:hypothetical protein [Candidatus Eremiobacteraeota bacterium]
MKFRLRAPRRPIDRPDSVRPEIFVILDVPEGQAEAPFVIEGPPRWVEEVRERVLMSYGVRGRFIEESTTGQDLEVAMAGDLLKPYEPERLD